MGTQTVPFGTWLLHRLDRLDMTPVDAERRSGVRANDIRRYITGVRRPSFRAAVKLAPVLGVSVEEFCDRAGIEVEARRLRERPVSLYDVRHQLDALWPTEIPVIELEQLVSAGPGNAVVQGYEYMPSTQPQRQRLYSAVVSGKCMEPEIRPGDRVVFDPEMAPLPGRLVVAVLDHEQAVVKRLTERNGKRYLESLDGQSIRVDERVRCVGVVVEVRRQV